ncbi:MAG: hypothetical protein JST80_07020 [Bdellovibrionales bacterium]|nr:hypothetical protein [Bdellovibrionales bacterium]
MRYLLVILLSILIQARTAHALVEVPTFRFGLGYSMIKFTYLDTNKGGASDVPLGSMLTLSPSFLWDIPQVRSRIGFHFLADVGSQFGFVTIIGVGADFVFYPMGLSSSREMRDDGSFVVKTRVSPFIQLQITPEKMSITVPNDNPNAPLNQRTYFNVLMIETSIGVGVDYPMSDNTVLFGGLHYRFAGYTSDETTVGKVTYGGPALLVGIMTNFY